MTTVAAIVWICVGLYAVWQLIPDEAKHPDEED